MKPAEKAPQKEPAASPPNLERRRFLRNVLVAGALAPLACSKEPSETSRSITLLQNRPFQVGGLSLLLTSCREGREFPSVSISICQQCGPGPGHSVSMLVPGSFRFQEGSSEYYLYVESISHGKPDSANITLTKKDGTPQHDGERHPETTDLFTIGAGAAFLAALFLAIFQKDKGSSCDGLGLPLSPKRPHQ